MELERHLEVILVIQVMAVTIYLIKLLVVTEVMAGLLFHQVVEVGSVLVEFQTEISLPAVTQVQQAE